MDLKNNLVLDKDESLNAQKIIDEINSIYVNGDNSISSMAKDLDLNIYPPRRKVNVMIIGNHSAGKSSFINWYIQDNIQSTGVAIETQGFTFITSGIKKTVAPIKGESTIMLFPYLKLMKERFGKPLVENIYTCVSISKENSFELVDFIDTPGLVDGDITYPFDVNESILYLADFVDLILVFMDPMGQALCSRTMEVVKSLNMSHYDKMKYYLTKADTVATPRELMKLMVQITQNIKENINNQHGLEIPIMWLPKDSCCRRESSDSSSLEIDETLNQIWGVCDVIDKTIHQKVQDNLSQIEIDCVKLRYKLRMTLERNQIQIAAKKSRQIVSTMLLISAWFIPLILFLCLITKYQERLPSFVHDATLVFNTLNLLHQLLTPISEGILPTDFVGMIKVYVFAAVLFITLTSISKFIHIRSKNLVAYPKDFINHLSSFDATIQEILTRRDGLFSIYVDAYMKEAG